MEGYRLCPGKIEIKQKNQHWYIPAKYGKICEKYYCESCFKEFSNALSNQSQFSLEVGTKHYCDWNREFKKSSIVINNVRISIVNPYTLYRYQIKEVNDFKIKVGIPNKTNYMIAIENWENNDNTRILIENIKHGDKINQYYCKIKNNLSINFMSYESDLTYDESDEKLNTITFTINKLIRRSEYGIGSYYVVDGKPFDVQIELVTDNDESNKMNNVIDKYKNLTTTKKKIIIVDNFI